MLFSDLAALLVGPIDGSVLALIVIPAVSAYISGKVGVRRGLEQARKQQAFERRLVWYEETFRSFKRATLALQKLSVPVTAENLAGVGSELLKCSEEARVFL